MKCCEFKDENGNPVVIDFASTADESCGGLIDTCNLTKEQIDALNRGALNENNGLNVSVINTILKRSIECLNSTALVYARVEMTENVKLDDYVETPFKINNVARDHYSLVNQYGNYLEFDRDGLWEIQMTIGVDPIPGGLLNEERYFVRVNEEQPDNKRYVLRHFEIRTNILGETIGTISRNIEGKAGDKIRGYAQVDLVSGVNLGAPDDFGPAELSIRYLGSLE